MIEQNKTRQDKTRLDPRLGQQHQTRSDEAKLAKTSQDKARLAKARQDETRQGKTRQD